VKQLRDFRERACGLDLGAFGSRSQQQYFIKPNAFVTQQIG
jgi:hypothetical protein